MQLCRVEHFFNILVLTFGRDCYCITPKSDDKYVVKVFNSTELHFSEIYFFQNWYFSVRFPRLFLNGIGSFRL